MAHASDSEAILPQDAPRRRRKQGFSFSQLQWYVVIGIGLMHVGAVLAFFPQFFSWSAVVVAVILYWVSGGLGITLCFHRLLTHRSFKTPKWFEYFLTACGCLAWQGGPIEWVGVHRLHHKHSDSDLDPHTPNHGFTWSHIFWCMYKDPEDMPAKDAAKDLQRDPGLRLLDRFFWVPQFVLAIILFTGGEAARHWLGWQTSGLSWIVWGIFVRTIFVYHVTWFVNSASHTWGYRSYETKDRSTNLWWVALLGFGEGWHNNHHAHQRSAAHGLRWWEFDMTYLTIRLLGLVGLARDVVLPKETSQAVGSTGSDSVKAAEAHGQAPDAPEPKVHLPSMSLRPARE